MKKEGVYDHRTYTLEEIAKIKKIEVIAGASFPTEELHLLLELPLEYPIMNRDERWQLEYIVGQDDKIGIMYRRKKL